MKTFRNMQFNRNIEERSFYVTTYLPIGDIGLIRNQYDNGRYELLLISKSCNPLCDENNDGVCLESNMSRDEWRNFMMQWMRFSDKEKIKFASEALFQVYCA